MTDRSDTHNAPLPLSFHLTIILSVALMFALGLVYFGFRNQRVATSYQVYGSQTVDIGPPTILRAVQFDNQGNQGNLPVRIVSVDVRQDGQTVASGEALQDIAAVPADLRIPTAGLAEGEATVRLSLEGWDQAPRTLDIPIQVAPLTGQVKELANLRPGLDAPIPATQARMDLSLSAGGMVEGLANRVWIRFADPGGRPADVHLDYQLGNSEPVQAPPTGRLGITPIQLAPSGPNQTLVVNVPYRDDTVTWEEMVAPGKLARLGGPPLIIEDAPPTRQTVTIETDGSDQSLFCTVWHGRNAAQVARADTKDGKATLHIDLPDYGLFWVTCDDHFLSSSQFLTQLPLLVAKDRRNTLQELLALGNDEPFFAHWPKTSLLTPAELDTMANYLQDRLHPAGQQVAQLLNTYDADVAELRATAEAQRDTVLILWAICGVGLLLWAIAVIIRQHKRLSRSFQEFQDGEDVGDDLAEQGITRKRSFVPALLVGLTVIANLAAFVWLLRLIFF